MSSEQLIMEHKTLKIGHVWSIFASMLNAKSLYTKLLEVYLDIYIASMTGLFCENS